MGTNYRLRKQPKFLRAEEEMNYNKQHRLIDESETPRTFWSLSKANFRLHWDINTVCDKNCFYCYARKQLIWYKYSTKSTLDNIIQQLADMKKSVEVVLLGGEPSAHPLYFYILDELYKLDNLTGAAVLTGGGPKVTSEWIIKHNQYDRFWFNFSFHPSEQTEIEKWKQKVLHANDINNGHCLVNILLAGPKWNDKINDMIEFCDNNNIMKLPNVIFSPKDCKDYMIKNTAYKEWISGYADRFERELVFTSGEIEHKYNDIDVYLNDLNRFKGWKCLNNNYAIEGANNTNITRMCDNSQKGCGEYMTCTLDKCMCQGLLTNEKYST